MATMRQIRMRIRVAKNIQQITKAMKMVATARFKRAQERVQQAEPYAVKMDQIIRELVGCGVEVEHPLLARRPQNRIGVLIVTAERGLCGSYNTNVIRKAIEFLHPFPADSLRLYMVGKKGYTFFNRRGYPIVQTFAIDSSGVSFDNVNAVSRAIRSAYESGEIDALHIVYAQFVNVITQRPTVLSLLPLQPPSDEGAGPATDYIFEPNPQVLLSSLLPRYLITQIYQVLLEANASELGARITSMSSATDHAGKMISSLTLSLNRARQAGITTELAEIMGGAEALKG